MEEDQRLLMDVNGENFAQVSEPVMGKCYDAFGKCCGCFCMVCCCGCFCNPYKSVLQGYRGIVTRFGTVKRIVTSGLQYVNPLSEAIHMVDVRTQVKKLSNQSVITKDNLPINIDGAIYYKIKNTDADVVKSKMGVSNFLLSTFLPSHIRCVLNTFSIRCIMWIKLFTTWHTLL